MPSRYLICVLICEGNSDLWFLPGLLKRGIEHLCQEHGRCAVEVEVIPVAADHQRPARIVEALAAAGRFDVLLYHHDGAPATAAEAKIEEVRRAVLTSRREPMVPVVPLRETEAWLIADPGALASALGLAPEVLGGRLPKRPRDAESVADPKALLNEITGLGLRRTGREKLRDRRPGLFAELADRVDLGLLRQVPSFARWWTDMTDALEKLGYKK
jgi:hypothetical protein